MRFFFVCLALLSSLMLQAAPAEYPDFSQCQQKMYDSFYLTPQGAGVYIAKNKILMFLDGVEIPNLPLLKHDPFLGLYLFEAPVSGKPLELWDNSRSESDKWLAAITPKEAYRGKKILDGAGMERMAQFSSQSPPNSIISGICYHVYGLGIGGQHYIQSKYLLRFLKQESPWHGDIGTRVSLDEGVVKVQYADPFFEDNPFRLGDTILSINGQTIDSLVAYNDVVMDLPPGEKITAVLKRGDRQFTVELVPQHRFGGGYVRDTFLERFGIVLDASMRVKSVKPDAVGGLKWLHPGDQLLYINRKKLDSGVDMRAILGGIREENIKFLIQREGFQFFIQIPTRWAS